MFRNLILSCVAGATIWLCATPHAVEAGQPAQIQFQVLVQDGSGWHTRGTYPLQSDARQAAMQLWRDGHRVLIQEVVIGGEK